jgi:N-methylhydantoinase A
MITNEGFRDVLHIGRHQRVEHYSIRQELPWQNRPLIKRRNRMVVPGRLAPPHGQELEPLDEERVREAARTLRDAGVESVAICFLFSYLNPAHEDRAKAIVSEILPDAFVTTSSFVSPQFREFERFTTAALAAFVGPKVRMYITRLDRSLKSMGLTADLRIMASNGGVATASMVSEKPTLTLLSGLAAGVLAGAWIGGLAERRKLITFDIGGTSADIGIIVDGRLAETDARSTSIAGFPLLTPMIDIHTIGAGGGSIAYIDHGGAFRVGPRSAGAVPGPAAYGMGGEEPTVTDANLVLGRLDADDFLGGGMKLDADAARRAVSGLATKLGLGLSEAAEGIITVINANMANAIRSRTIQKGIDPRGFSLVAFGGAGPLQGAEVAAILGIPEVIAPLTPASPPPWDFSRPTSNTIPFRRNFKSAARSISRRSTRASPKCRLASRCGSRRTIFRLPKSPSPAQATFVTLGKVMSCAFLCRMARSPRKLSPRPGRRFTLRMPPSMGALLRRARSKS